MLLGLINVLDISVANLIAAGEVVERPASAVKELIENSIDAKAEKITVEIKKGGISMLRVTDDGCGMSAEDALVSIRRHATSKIKTSADLNSIMTLGFRGEALAAISSVTHFRILTKRKEDDVGTTLECEYGGLPHVFETGLPNGTTVICDGLFAETPARLKFLKSDSGEAAAVQSVVEKAAVSHPEVAFKFISDGNVKFSSPGDGKLYNAVYSVFGKVFAASLTEVIPGDGNIKVSGYVSSPDYARGNRGMQLFFVNGRSVRSKIMTAALEQAYESYIPSGRFPSCVLDLNINGAYVDVNIHPSKLEVKFSDERSVFSTVYYAVKSALENRLARPTFEINSKKMHEESERVKVTAAFVPIPERGEKKAEQLTISSVEIHAPKREEHAMNVPKAADNDNIKQSAFDIPKKTAPTFGELRSPTVLHAEEMSAPRKIDISEIVFDEKAEEKLVGTDNFAKPEAPMIDKSNTDARIPGKEAGEVPEYRIVGELFDLYIIIELGDKIIMADKHAAHERINFEILRASMRDISPHTQLLLVPERISLSATEAELCSRYKDEFERAGFALNISENEAVISGIPICYGVDGGKELFLKLMSSLLESGVPIDIQKVSVFEKALYQTCCKMSIKAGRHYEEPTVKWICDNLLRYDCIKFCPHGRPVAFEITKRELDARFGRIK